MMDFRERLLAITDIETTGDVPGVHEVIEIGLVVCKPRTFEIVKKLNIKIKPLKLENAIPKAMERNGYKEEDWSDAVTLKEAMEIYSQNTSECVFYAFNITFDWSFISYSFKETGVKDTMDYHRFDIMSMAHQKIGDKVLGPSLNNFSVVFGLSPEIFPHNALNGAMQAHMLLQKL